MRLNVNVNGCPTPPPKMPGEAVKAAKSSLVFGIISIFPALASLFIRIFGIIGIGLFKDIAEELTDELAVSLLWPVLISCVSSFMFIIIATIVAIIGIVLFPRSASGKIATPADKIGLALSIVSLVISVITLVLCIIGLIPYM